MWCPEGYVTLSEILAQIMWDSDLMPMATNRPPEPNGGRFTIDTGMSHREEITAFQVWMTAGFLQIFRDDIRVCLASGNLVRLDTSLATGLRRDPFDFNPDFGPFPQDYAMRVRLSQWEFTYLDTNYCCVRSRDDSSTVAALDGLPICINEARLPVAIEKLPAWLWNEIPKLREPSTNEAWSSRDSADAIVQAFLARRIRTKPEAKRMFGRDLPTAAWQALWEEAVAIMPSLARPGRR